MNRNTFHLSHISFRTTTDLDSDIFWKSKLLKIFWKLEKVLFSNFLIKIGNFVAL